MLLADAHNTDGVTMDFPKGSPIEDIFNKLEEILDKKSKQAEKHVLNLYDEPSEKHKSARGMLQSIKQNTKMDCGCCYKLSEPALDILMTELLLLQHTINEVKGMVDGLDSETANKIKKTIDHNARILHVMISGLRELGAHPSIELYESTMKVYAATYKIMNKGSIEKDGLFDHILGMEFSIDNVVSLRNKDKETKSGDDFI